jgi:hypothetical protein
MNPSILAKDDEDKNSGAGSREAFLIRHALLSDSPETSAQLELSNKHGTPLAFSEACSNSIGSNEITWDEAEEAVKIYVKEWNIAGVI